MSQGPMQAPSWAAAPRGQFVTVVRNLSTRYLAITVETIVGLVMLPFNLAHLGPAAYGLWVLTASERIIWGTQRLTNQLNGVLFPVSVDNDASQQRAHLQRILVEGTRLSLATVVPVAMMLIVLAGPIVHAWLGARAELVSGCIPVIQILAFAVMIRVGNATGNTLLKGAGQHRFLAWVSLTTGAVNVALSVLLIGPFGLSGVAVGTLIPIACAGILVLFPAACRRVGLPVAHTAAISVLPALWPAALVGTALFAKRLISSGTLLAVVLQAIAGGVLSLALFVIALDRDNRAVYTAKLKELAA